MTKHYEAGNLEGAFHAIQYILDVTERSRLEVGQLLYLLGVAVKSQDGEPATMLELAEYMNRDHSFISRNTKSLSVQGLSKPLVEQAIDPMTPKYRLVSLTPGGEKLLDNVAGLMSGALRYNRRTQKVSTT